MSAAAIVGILVAIIVVGVAAWYVAMQRRRTQDLVERLDRIGRHPACAGTGPIA